MDENHTTVEVKIDTGAYVTVMPDTVYKNNKYPKLSVPEKNLYGPGNNL